MEAMYWNAKKKERGIRDGWLNILYNTRNLIRNLFELMMSNFPEIFSRSGSLSKIFKILLKGP